MKIFKIYSRIVVLTVIVLSVAGLHMAASIQASAAQEGPVKFTILLPFTGVYQNMGTAAKNGFLLGIEQASEELGVNIDDWVEFEILDTLGDADHTLELTQKSVADGSKAILGLASSATGIAISDYVLNDAKIPLIVFGACGTPQLRTSNPLFLRTTFSVYQFSLGLAHWIETHPYEHIQSEKPRWACIYSGYQAGLDVCEGFKLGYGDIGEEVGRIPVPLKTMNKQKYLINLSMLKPDFALVFFIELEAESFIRDYYRFNVHEKTPLLALGNVLIPPLLNIYEKTLDQYGTAIGITSTAHWDAALENQANQDFVSLYRKTYGNLPSVYAVHGFDTGRLLVKTLAELNGKWEQDKAMHLMRTLPVISPLHGKQLEFDTHGDPIIPLYIFKTKRVGDRLVNELIGETPPVNLDDYLQ